MLCVITAICIFEMDIVESVNLEPGLHYVPDVQ